MTTVPDPPRRADVTAVPNRPRGEGVTAVPGRRADVLRVLRDAEEPLGIVRIADALGVHPNTVRFHLDTLVERGQAEQVRPERTRPGRPPLLFRAVRRMDPGGPRHYRMLAEILAQSVATDPDPKSRAVEAGRAWGRHAASTADEPAEPREGLVALLDDLGFAPEPSKENAIGLRHCPFLELAESEGRIVCAVHLGLMRGALEAWNAPETVTDLHAFTEPDLCLAHLAPV